MVTVKPFRGYLANINLAQKLIAPPYDVINTAEARKMAEGNQYSFLNVNKPEITLPMDTDPYAQIVYETGRKNLQDFISKGWLQRDDQARFYIYSQIMQGREQIGLMSASAVADYENDLIKKHEKTIEKKEKDRTLLTDIQGANVGPVFLTYRSQQNTAIQEKIKHLTEVMEPYCVVEQMQDETDVPVSHRLWKVDASENLFFEQEFKQVGCTYVADGHHRSAAAYNVGKMRKERALAEGKKITGEEDFNYFMSIIYPSDNLEILDYNRVIKSLNGLTAQQFMDRLKADFADLRLYPD